MSRQGASKASGRSNLITLPSTVDHLVAAAGVAQELVNPDPTKYDQLWVQADTGAWRLRPGHYSEYVVDSVDAAADTWVDAAGFTNYQTGNGPFYVHAATALCAGMSLATPYWVIGDTATTIKWATTLANAIDGVAINITSAGTGAHSFGRAENGWAAALDPTAQADHGYGAMKLAVGDLRGFTAPKAMSCVAFNNGDILTYWWV